ncbi:unnamed protein product [Phaedon cochleariae]|uniref:Hemolymph juvenile hormone binding protein n=1 Tax=Phaedon cochleariae TaxID=80249 RepID=A0A9P0DYC1_PHACE|nr:unnamed protein product [Phaedon cochleariae]
MTWRSGICYCAIVLFFLGCADSQVKVKIQEPGISRFLNRVTNTTFGLIRTGVDIFGNTIERITNSFATIEERLRAILELVRKQLIKGVPELSIPVLDPLHIDKIEFNVNHEAANVKGRAEDLTIRHISKFLVDKESFSDLGKLRFKLDLNLTFPYIKVNGTYNIDGEVGGAFRIFGNGPFRLNLIDLKLGTSTILKFTLPARLRVESISLDVKLKKLENNFENLMKDKETGVLINKAISKLAPEALRLLWPELKPSIEVQVKKYINDILENTTVVNMAKRLFNIT